MIVKSIIIKWTYRKSRRDCISTQSPICQCRPIHLLHLSSSCFIIDVAPWRCRCSTTTRCWCGMPLERGNGSRAGRWLQGSRWDCPGYGTSAYRLYQQGHMTWRSRPTVPSVPLPLTTSSSSWAKGLVQKESETQKENVDLKKVGYLKEM